MVSADLNKTTLGTWGPTQFLTFSPHNLDSHLDVLFVGFVIANLDFAVDDICEGHTSY